MLDHVRFQLGDFVEYLRRTNERFDVALASGVLYQMQEPLELLVRLADVGPASSCGLTITTLRPSPPTPP